MSIAALVLAAGQGTRMASPLPKALVPLRGRAIVRRLLDSLEAAGIAELVVVVGHRAEELKAALGPRYGYVLQERRLGMAHAVEVARPTLEGCCDRVLVTVGDSPLVQPETIQGLLRAHLSSGAACSFLSAVYEHPPAYARVLRDPQGAVICCVEERDCSPEQARVRELSTSHFLFEAAPLWRHLGAVAPHPGTGERYLTDITQIFAAQGLSMQALPVEDPMELAGLNTLQDLARAESWLEARRA